MPGSHHVTADQLLVTHSVTPGEHGSRLDNFIKENYRRRSREQIKRFIQDGSVTVVRDQGPHLQLGRLKPSFQLLTGDEVQILTRRKPEPPVDFSYKILYEDETLFIIDKPGNLPVHPAGRYYFNTLLTHLKSNGFTAPMKANREFFLPHRIDRETSGILVLTKTSESCAGMTEQFASRTTEKGYLAIVKGRVEQKEFNVCLPLQRDPKSKIRLKMGVIPIEEGGLAAHTDFKTISHHGNYTLVECFPKTGRQHQIRVHLEAAGYPILGDKLYGIPESLSFLLFERPDSKDAVERSELPPELELRLILPRHALHAYRIGFKHPMTGKPMEFRSPLPADLSRFLSQQTPG